MKITRVTSTTISQPPADSLVELETDQGLTGISIGRAGAEAEKLGREVLVNEDPRAVSGLWQKLLDNSASTTTGYRAVALLDTALWDLKAKSNDEPLWKTLGGARPRANAYASIDGANLGDEEIADWCRTMATDYGFRDGKLSVGADNVSVAQQLAMLRDALLQNAAYPVLMIDAGDRWTPEQAISNIKELEKEFDLAWVESSEEAWGLDGIRRVSDNIFAAVCATTEPRSAGQFFPPFDRHAIDIISITLETAGITGSMQIADAAYGFELPITLRASPGNTAAHLAAALPNYMSMEVLNPAPSDGIISSDVSIEDGRAIAGDKPGNGLAIDRDALFGDQG